MGALNANANHRLFDLRVPLWHPARHTDAPLWVTARTRSQRTPKHSEGFQRAQVLMVAVDMYPLGIIGPACIGEQRNIDWGP